MKLETKKYFYFLGIGGIGMSALARYFNRAGKMVSGYDKTPSPLTEALIREGISIHFDEDVKRIHPDVLDNKTDTLVIYTPAVPEDHSEYVYFKSRGYDILKRADVLGLITRHTHTIAVAGTHGKTTTSSMIAHLIRSSGKECNAFLGGITQNYNTNLLLSENPLSTVVEADEYDRSFLTLNPDIAVITSLDPDHLDIYGNVDEMIRTYSLFAGKVKSGGTLITKEKNRKLLSSTPSVITYGMDEPSQYKAQNITVQNGLFRYSVICPGKIMDDVTLGVPGMHNVENSLAAVAAAEKIGISENHIKEALRSFRGVRRRFDVQFASAGVVYIDDYAHHPEEIKAFISAVRQVYPSRKLTGVFQPHLYSRTRDFAGGFAGSLGMLDELILIDIYPAREKPIPGITSGMLLEQVKLKNKMLCKKEELVSELRGRELDVLLTIGAGDIDMYVEPIKQELKKKYAAKAS